MPKCKHLEEELGILDASVEGHVKCIRALIKKRIDVNMTGTDSVTALMLGAQKGHEECVALLIKAGASVNASMKYDKTALTIAAENRSSKCVELLIGGANLEDVACIDNSGYVALTRAAFKGRDKCVEVQWQIQDFPLGGALTCWGGANLRRVHFSAKTKEMDPVGGGGGTPAAPPRIRQ